MRVLFTWDVRPELRTYLEAGLADTPGVALVFPRDPSPADLVDLAPGADVAVGWRPTAELLAAATALRLWINPGAGVQHLVPVLRAANAGRAVPVALANGHGNAPFVAQHAVALLLALTNRIVPHHAWMAAGRWRMGDAEAASIPLAGRTVGLLGYGHVNRRVHRLLAGFGVDFAILKRSWGAPGAGGSGDEGMRAIGTGGALAAGSAPGGGLPFEAPPPAATFTPDRLDAFLERVDTVVVAVPETPETTGWIDAAALRRLGPAGLVVNVARGPVIVEADLFAALSQRAIAGAALDVWYDYAPERDADGRRFPYTAPFHLLDNVVLSPHRAASPLDDLGRWDEAIENIRRAAAGRADWVNAVDLERGY